jgi:hypothetical protein
MLNTDVVFDKSEQSTMFHSFKFQMIIYVQDDFPHLSSVKTTEVFDMLGIWDFDVVHGA